MSRPVNILAILPYPLLRQQLLEIAADYENINITVEVGQVEDSIPVLRAHEGEPFDVILSRGGTQLILSTYTDLPVINIPIDGLDLMKIFSLIKNYEGKPAIVAYPNIIDMAKQICSAMELNYELFSISSRSNAQQVIARLKKEGYTLIVGDTVSVEYAHAAHLSTILITSGKLSIDAALKNAIQIVTQNRKLTQNSAWANSFTGWNGEQYFIFSRQQELLFQSSPDRSQALIRLLQKKIKPVSIAKEASYLRSFQEEIYLILGRETGSGEATRYLFCVRPIHQHSRRKKKYHHLEWKTHSQIETLVKNSPLNTHYSTIPEFLLQKNAHPLKQALLITGEQGTEKNNLLYNLFLQTTHSNAVLMIIHCAFITESELKLLLGDMESPFWTKDAFIYFKELEMMSDSTLEWLISELEAGQYAQDRTLLFTLQEPRKTEASYANAEVRYEYLLSELCERLGCVLVPISPLRGNRHKISHYVTLFLDQINQISDRQIVGLTPDAMEFLQQSPWPQNTSQLKKILFLTAQITNTPWISSADLRNAFQQVSYYPENLCKDTININQSLEDIKYDIILKKMQQNMTQEQIADQLKISRSTVWRILREKKSSNENNTKTE